MKNNITGLNSRQVAINRKKYGKNIIPESATKSLFEFFLEVYYDKMNMILIIMLLVFLGLGFAGYGDFTDVIGLGAVLLTIGIIGAITKSKAQQYTMDLKNKTLVRFYNVLRGGTVSRIDSREIVVGDIIILQTGDIIPADGYIIDGTISVNNSVLNGESKEVIKRPIKNYNYIYHKATADDIVGKNLLFSGTSVLGGECRMHVTRVGINTENAQMLLSLRNITKPKTDLDIKLDKLAEKISIFGTIGATLIAIFLLWNDIYYAGGITNYFTQDWHTILNQVLHIITISLTVIVAAVPEGLPFIITIIIAQNARKMVHRNVLAKNTHKIPEAGNINILCTDKTGTLTYGNMVPVGCFLGDGTNVAFENDTAVGKMSFNNIVLNNSAKYDKLGRIIGGTLTQRALLSVVNYNFEYAKIIKENKIVSVRSFNSTDKYSSVVSVMHGKTITYFSGAPEIILKHTGHYLDARGRKHIINEKLINQVLRKNARQAKRMIALAYFDGAASDIQSNLVLTALVGLRDEVRREVPAAVQSMYDAGIQVIMITGDNLDTARVIAQDAGIVRSKQDIVITASELDNMSDKQVKEKLSHIRTIARAVPETKLRLVKLAQEMNLCIGMCGDGTNDAPALKRADVGFAMGSGTDVCKEASDIIITDDNFVSVTDAVLFGRTFMKNIKKFLLFQLPINLTLVLICLSYPIFVGVQALLAIQILTMNIVVDSLNSIAFGAEPTKREYLTEPPATKGAPILSAEMRTRIMFSVLVFFLIFIITMTPFFKAMFDNSPDKNMAARFTLLLFIAAANGFCVRTDDVHLLRGLGHNPMFLIIATIIVLGTIAIMLFGGSVLGGTPFSALQWTILSVMALAIIPLDIARKKFTTK